MIHKSRWAIFSLILAGAVGISACSPGTTSSSGNGNFPLTPNPLNVSSTLETDLAADFAPGGYMYNLDTTSSSGTLADLDLLRFTPLQKDANGELLPAFDTTVTMTPVSAIENLPFSQGFLGAVHIGPDGILSVKAVTLRIEVPGEYDPKDVIGFSADGTGDQLHLYPIVVSSYDGKTYAEFEVVHFSIYGLALATASEIQTLQAHPPAEPVSQDDQDLAPLMPIHANSLQRQLNTSYNRLVSSDLDNLETLDCSKVDVLAYNYNSWVSKVEQADERDYFENRIQADQSQILDRLTQCIRISCPICIGPQSGVTPDSHLVQRMAVMIEFASDLSTALHLGDEKINYWWRLENQCLKSAGLPLLPEGIAADAQNSAGELTCP